MSILGAALLTFVGLGLLHRLVQDEAPSAVAWWTVLALLLATSLWPTIMAGTAESLVGALTFATASLSLFLFWRRGREGLVWPLIAGALLLVALLAPHLARGRVEEITLPGLSDLLFSSPRGLLYWSPILWGGVAGMASLPGRDGRRGWIVVLAAVLAVLASSDVGSLGRVSGVRFHAALPLLGLGLSRSLAWLYKETARRPALPLAAGGAALVAWNALFMDQYQAGRIPRDLPVRFSNVTRISAEIFARSFGSPNAWPANWVFAWRHHVSPAKYDVVVGQDSLQGGFVPLDDPRIDPHLLAEGWGPHTRCRGFSCRAVMGSARILLFLRGAQAGPTAIRVQGPAALRVSLNGAVIGEMSLADPVVDVEFPKKPRWRRGVNELVLDATPSGGVRLLGLDFPASVEE